MGIFKPTNAICSACAEPISAHLPDAVCPRDRDAPKTGFDFAEIHNAAWKAENDKRADNE